MSAGRRSGRRYNRDTLNALSDDDAADGADVRQGRSGWKLAQQVALRIEEEVRAGGWKVGTNLGSEADLLERYGVSRAVIREAVGLTEYLGVARMRRGPGGGLLVTVPDTSAVITAVVVYLTYRQVRLDDIFTARRPLEDLAARLAAARRSDLSLRRLDERVEFEGSTRPPDHWVLHDLVASASTNPVLELFVGILGRITSHYTATERLSARKRREALSDVREAHGDVVEAIRARDGDAAGTRMVAHLDTVSSLFGTAQLDRMLTLEDELIAGQGEKLAGATARRIFTDVVDLGWPVGQMLGSEPDLLRNYEVSRAVLREASRLLELHGVLRTQRGVGGGIFISSPDEVATTDALAVYLESRGVTPPQLFEVREAIELASVDLAATRLDKYAIGLLTEGLGEEMAAPAENLATTSHVLHLRIAELTGNPAIELFLHALTRLTEQHAYTPEEGFPMSYEEAAASVARAHARIVAAIAAGDSEAAKRRMLRHLRAVHPLLR